MAGAVYDRGYRPYEGERGGRKEARAALWRATVRRALGFRRPWRQKIVPFVLLGIVTIPAIVNVGVAYLTRDTPATGIEFITYREYVGVSNALLVFVALTAPDIMCPDRRQRVLPLLFARPLTGVDYVLAKVGAMAAILFGFSFLPQVVLFVGQMLVSKDGALNYARDNAEVLWQVPVAVGLLALYYAVIGVAISSLTSRRIIAGASLVGLFLVTSVVSALLVESGTSRVETSPAFGPPATIIGDDGEPIVILPPPDDSFDDRRWTDPTAAPLLNLAALPLVLRDLVFLGQVDDADPMAGLDHAGLYAMLLYAVVIGGGFTVLFIRYDEVER